MENDRVTFPFFILHCLKEHFIFYCKDNHFQMKNYRKRRKNEVVILFSIIKTRCFRRSNDFRITTQQPFYLQHFASTCLQRQLFVTTKIIIYIENKEPLDNICVLNSSVFAIFLLLFLDCICFLPIFEIETYKGCIFFLFPTIPVCS